MIPEIIRTNPARLRYEISYAEKRITDLCVNLSYALMDGDTREAEFCRTEILINKYTISICRDALRLFPFAQYPIFEEV